MDRLVLDIIEKNESYSYSDNETENFQEFKEEALEILDSIETILYNMDKNFICHENVKELCRLFHGIKGIAGFASQYSIERIAHETETLLFRLNSSCVKYDNIAFELFLTSIGLIKHICKDPQVTKEKRFNEILDIHSHNIESFGKKELKKMPIDLKKRVEKLNYVKIPMEKIMDLKKSSETIRNCIGELDTNNIIYSRMIVEGELKKIDVYLEKFNDQKLNTFYKKLYRVAKYTLKSQAIDAKIIFEGGDIEISKRLIDFLFIPFSQIIRNAIIHGLLDKNNEKILSISAIRKDKNITFIIKNNGKPINKDAIRKKLEEKNIDFSDGNILNAIFLENFSTKDDTDIFSGRGIGLNLVKREIERINGEIKVISEKGEGTIFEIEIPIN